MEQLTVGFAFCGSFCTLSRGLDALGIKMIKSKAKEFFYRRYAGFNTLVVRV